MRRHLTSIAILALCLTPSLAFGAIKLQKSQFAQKGKLHIGGEIGYESDNMKLTSPSDTDLGSTSTLTLAPTVGYFVMPGLEIGGMLDYSSTSLDPKGGSSTSGSVFSIGPEVAYYYKVQAAMFVYGRGYLVYDLSHGGDFSKVGDQTVALKDNDVGGYKWAIGGGVAVPFGSRVGGLLSLGLDYQTVTTSVKPKQGGGQEMDYQTSGPALKSAISIYF